MSPTFLMSNLPEPRENVVENSQDVAETRAPSSLFGEFVSGDTIAEWAQFTAKDISHLDMARPII